MSSSRLILLACLCVPAALSAQTIITWANAGTDFGTAANWTGNVAPGASDIAQFTTAAPTAQPNVGGAISVGGIEFASGAGMLTLSGAGPLTIGTSGINNQSTNAQVISVPLIFGGASSTISNIGTLTISGGITNNTTLGLTLAGAGTSGTISGVISGTGSLIKIGTGNWTLSGANTVSGGIAINGGMLSISTDSNLGVVPAVITPAAVTLNGGTLQAAANFTISANRGITLGASGGTISTVSPITLTYEGVITGSGSLTKTGPGNLLLTGANTYTGDTTISAGFLQVGTGGSITGNVVNNGNLQFIQTNDTNYAGQITGTGSLTKTSTGTLTLSGVNTYSGGTIVFAGTLADGIANALPATSIVTISSSARLNVNYDETVRALIDYSAPYTGVVNVTNGASLTISGATTFNGIVSGTGGLVKTGSGTFVLGGTNTYSGGTTVSGGTISISSDANLGTGSLTLDGGTLQTTASVTLNSSRSIILGSGGGTFDVVNTGGISNVTQYAGAITGTGGLVLGSGSLLLTGANTYAGGTTINGGGFLQIGQGGTTGSIMGNVTGSGELLFQRSDTVTFPGSISGAVRVYHAGTGTLVLSGANTYTGKTTVNFGTLALGADVNLGTAPASAQQMSVYLALGATLRSITSFALSATRGLFVDTGANFETDPGTTLTYDGIIAGHGGWAKSGAGTLALGGANTFTGGVTITAGTVQLGAHNTLPASGALTLTGGTLAMNGFNQTLGVITLNSSSTLDFSSGASALSFANSSGAAWTGTLSILNYTDGSDTLRFGTTSGGLTATQLGQINFGGLAAQIDAFGYVSAIPEPSTYAMIAGWVLLGVTVWRRGVCRRRERK